MSVPQAFEAQARACAALGSDFTARLCRLAAERLDRSSALGRLILDWQGDPSGAGDSVPLRFCGVLHRLVLRGDAGLAPHWPPHRTGDTDLWHAVAAALEQHEAILVDWVASPPQTNEVRRASAIVPALHLVAAHVGMPLALHELGASAGLNLICDRFRVMAGQTAYGSATSPLRLRPDWSGKAPAPVTLRIAARRGVDLRPVDPGQSDDRERLLSYLWADQPERRTRTETAIRMATSDRLTVDRGDAGDWLARALPDTPEDTCAVVFHTIAWQYFPEATRAVAEAAMQRHTRPLARIAMEADDQRPGARLTLTLWPGGRQITLARVDFHGRWVDWTGPTSI